MNSIPNVAARKVKATKPVNPETPWVKYAGIHENDPIFLEVLESMKKEKQKRIRRARREDNLVPDRTRCR